MRTPHRPMSDTGVIINLERKLTWKHYYLLGNGNVNVETIRLT